jgi:hypothetical protein
LFDAKATTEYPTKKKYLGALQGSIISLWMILRLKPNFTQIKEPVAVNNFIF